MAGVRRFESCPGRRPRAPVATRGGGFFDPAGHEVVNADAESVCYYGDILGTPADLTVDLLAHDSPCYPELLTKLSTSDTVGEEILVHSETKRLIEGHRVVVGCDHLCCHGSTVPRTFKMCTHNHLTHT